MSIFSCTYVVLFMLTVRDTVYLVTVLGLHLGRSSGSNQCSQIAEFALNTVGGKGLSNIQWCQLIKAVIENVQVRQTAAVETAPFGLDR